MHHCCQGAWVAQLLQRPTLDLSSGHDLTVHGIKSCIRLCADSTGFFLLSLPLCCSHACMLSHSKLNKGTEKKNPSKNGPLSCKMLTTGEARRVRERGMVYGDSLYVLLYFAVNLKRMSKIRLLKCMKQQKQQNMVSIEATLSIY